MRASEIPATGASGDGRSLVVVAVAVAILVAAIGGFAVSAQSSDRDPSRSVRSPNATAGLATLHERGVTGENVSVGIVDVTGFDTDHPTLADRVVAARSFAPGESVANGGRTGHGTAAASVVARTAPESELYLATFDTVDGYRSAMAWLVQRDVDVIVVPVSFYGQAGDGTSRAARIASRAAQLGIVVVAPVGNLGRGHWTGRYDAVVNRTLQFDGGAHNYLYGNGTRFSLWLSWRGPPERNYTVELYAAEPDDDRLVARSQPYPGDAAPNERIVARLDPREEYYVTVRGPPEPTGDRLTVASPTHAFQHRRRRDSVVAPATGERVLAVGAYNGGTGRAERFSSAGPVDGGRPGVDLLAPDRLPAASRPDGFVGSSAAAPYVAGVAALALDADPDRSPAEVERTLERTARDVGRPGTDPVAGHGRIAPVVAVASVHNGTDAAPPDG